MKTGFGRLSRSRGLVSAGITCLVLASLCSGGSSAQAGPLGATPVLPTNAASALEPGPVPELFTETSTTTREADGTYTAEISDGPVNYQDGSGDWVPISNELVVAPGARYAVQNEGNSYTVSIPENPATTPIKFEEDGAWVTMRILGADSVEPEVDGSEAVFADLAGTDEVRYEATNSGLKETIVLDVPPVVAPSYSYTLRVSSGITPVLTDAQTVEFRDDSGEVRFAIPPGFMTDSAQPEAAYSDDVTYALSQTGSSWRFTLTPSATWLSDASRVYPVMIDPTVDKITQKSCWLQEEQAGTTHCGEWILKAGANENLKKRRALLDFNVNGIPSNAAVSNATAWIWLDHYSTSGSGGATSWALYNPSQLWGTCASWAYTCHNSGTWTGGGSQGQISNTQSIGGTTSGWQSWDITGKAAGWINGTQENRGVLLRQTGENVKKVLGFVSQAHNATWAHPLLRVTYTVNESPSVGGPTVGPVTNGPGTTWTTPTFSAAVSDPEGQAVAAGFEVQTTGGTFVWSGWSNWVSSGAVGSLAIPAGKLTIDTTYRVRAVALDSGGAQSAWSSFMAFTVDEPGPEYTDDSPSDPPDPTSTAYPGVNSYELRDLQRAAEIYGITVQEAVNRFGHQLDFSSRVAQAEANYPSSFGSSELQDDSSGAPTVHFVGAVPVGAVALFAGSPVAVNLVADADYSSTERLALVESAHAAVVAMEQSFDSGVVTYFDEQSESVVTEVTRPSSAGPTVAQLETGAATEMATDHPTLSTPDVEASVLIDAAERGSLEGLRGGTAIGKFNSTYYCTSAFPVKDPSTGEKGLLTARHCDNNLTRYSHHTDTERTRLYNASRFLPESHGDMQYHGANSLEKVKRQFYIAQGVPVKLTGYAEAEKDDFMCLYGRATNGDTASGKPTCSTVRQVGVSVHYEPDYEGDEEWNFSGLVMMNDYVSWEGDSGGPWFYGGTAYGVHSGRKSTGLIPTKRSLFTPVNATTLGLMNLELYQTD